jgi:hypothetical protein
VILKKINVLNSGRMKKKGHLFAPMLVGFLIISAASRAEVICEKVRPLKPVRCVCGKLIDPTGGPVSGATVTVVKDGTDFATKTASDGTFFFDQLRSGSYELSANADGLVPFRSPIVVSNPVKECKRGLLILLVLSYPDNCGSRVVGMLRIGSPKNPN